MTQGFRVCPSLPWIFVLSKDMLLMFRICGVLNRYFNRCFNELFVHL